MLPPGSLICLALSLLLPGATAVFADEVDVVDYHHELLGLPQPQATFFHRPRAEEKASLLYTLSDLGVVGAVNPGTGQIVWRHLLATTRGQQAGDDARNGSLRAIDGENTIVSAWGRTVSAWDATTGRSRWQTRFKGALRDAEIMAVAAGSETKPDVLALWDQDGKGLLRRIHGETGDVVWEYEDASGDVPAQVSTNVMHVFVVSLHGARGGYNLKITTLDPVTGKKVTDYTLSTKADIHAAEDVLLVGANSAAPIVAWTDMAKTKLRVNILGSTTEQALPLDMGGEVVTKVDVHAPHNVQSQPHFVVQTSSKTANRVEVYHVDIAKSTVDKAYELPKLAGTGSVSISCQDANVYFTRITSDEVLVFSTTSHGVLGRWPKKLNNGHEVAYTGVSEVVHRDGDKYAARIAAVTSSDDWILIRNGQEAWTRAEGLSGSVGARWAEIPGSEALAASLQAEAHSNPISAYVHRWQRHLNDLQHLPAYLGALPKRILSSILPDDLVSSEVDASFRDSFGFNKLVIIATRRGRVYALSTGNLGRVVWSVKPFGAMSEHLDLKGLWVDDVRGAVTIWRDDGAHSTIDIHDGKIMELVPSTSTTPIQDTIMVSSETGPRILSVGPGGLLTDIPTVSVSSTIVVRGGEGEITGLRLDKDDAAAKPVAAWTFRPAHQRIVEVVSRPAYDPVASIGRVLGDRSVLYKYLNSNTVLVSAVEDATFILTIYLLDTVTGDVLHSSVHHGIDTTQPITSILAENWFAYSFFSDETSDLENSTSSSKGHQLHVTELYESSIPNDRGPLGSTSESSGLLPSEEPNSQPFLPHAISQSFFVSEPIVHMSVSTTRQGISTRQLLCVLESGSIMGLPRQVIDPRRPVGRDATPLEAEEGLFRYAPVIEMDPRLLLTHQRTVLGIEHVITSPAVLESTSLVFACGIDVFGTRVAPSMAFDILGKGFGKVSLVLTVLALWVGVVVLAPMVSDEVFLWFLVAALLVMVVIACCEVSLLADW